MITKVRVPKLSTNVEEQTVTAWFRKEGERVRKGEPLLEMTTDKASFEVEAPASGTLLRVLAREKSQLPVGYVVAFLGQPSDALPDVHEENRLLLEKHRAAMGAGARARRRAPADGGRVVVRATPAARRLAREKGADLADVARQARVDVVTESVVEQYLAGRKP